MFASFILATLVAQATPAAATSCSGADPAIVSASLKSMVPQGGLNNVTTAVTVQNRGNMKQASNVLQSVQVYQDQTKVDLKGIPPLAPGQSYTFNYTFQRSVQANPGSTSLRFQLVFKQPNPPGNEDCNTSNDSYHLKV